jgi:hypothetical protein
LGIAHYFIRPQSPNFVTLLPQVVDLAEVPLLLESAEEGAEHLCFPLLALLHHFQLGLLMAAFEVEIVAGAIYGFLPLQVGLPCVLEGHLFGLESFILEEEFSLGIDREGRQSFGLDEALGESDGRLAHVVGVGLMHTAIDDLFAQHMADILSNLGPISSFGLAVCLFMHLYL